MKIDEIIYELDEYKDAFDFPNKLDVVGFAEMLEIALGRLSDVRNGTPLYWSIIRGLSIPSNKLSSANIPTDKEVPHEMKLLLQKVYFLTNYLEDVKNIREISLNEEIKMHKNILSADDYTSNERHRYINLMEMYAHIKYSLDLLREKEEEDRIFISKTYNYLTWVWVVLGVSLPFIFYFLFYQVRYNGFSFLDFLFYLSIPASIICLVIFGYKLYQYLDLGTYTGKKKLSYKEALKEYKDVNSLGSYKNNSKNKPEDKTYLRYDSLQTLFYNLETRLQNEVASLKSKANVNLIIGGLSTLAAIVIVFMFFYPEITQNKTGVKLHNEKFKEVLPTIAYFLPRITLVTFIEIFSFYFLRLYRTNMNEIQYYQNELTNIDYTMLGFRASLLGGDEEHIKNVINEILKKEHNRVIKKDETTAEIEKYKAESDYSKTIISSFLDYINFSKQTEKPNKDEIKDKETSLK